VRCPSSSLFGRPCGREEETIVPSETDEDIEDDDTEAGNYEYAQDLDASIEDADEKAESLSGEMERMEEDEEETSVVPASSG
jgi:hypothetical protein